MVEGGDDGDGGLLLVECDHLHLVVVVLNEGAHGQPEASVGPDGTGHAVDAVLTIYSAPDDQVNAVHKLYILYAVHAVHNQSL